ncbi:hypothetical protein H6796_01115 [Candidatus Nomurabacteria bacterium]|nr:hypothetical protein [Candidatus Nomurabacteria bacterium]
MSKDMISSRHANNLSKLANFSLEFESNRTIPEERARTKRRASSEAK